MIYEPNFLVLISTVFLIALVVGLIINFFGNEDEPEEHIWFLQEVKK